MEIAKKVIWYQWDITRQYAYYLYMRHAGTPGKKHTEPPPSASMDLHPLGYDVVLKV